MIDPPPIGDHCTRTRARTHTYTHYRAGASMLQTDEHGGEEINHFTDILRHDTSMMIYGCLFIYEWNQDTESHTHTDNTHTYRHIWWHTLNARVTLTRFIYIQNTISPWCRYCDNSLPHSLTHSPIITHTYIQMHTHIFLKNTHPLLRCWWLRNILG